MKCPFRKETRYIKIVIRKTEDSIERKHTLCNKDEAQIINEVYEECHGLACPYFYEYAGLGEYGCKRIKE